MSTSNRTDAPARAGSAVENPNRELIEGLREAADFLAEHPVLPPMLGMIHTRVYDDGARGTLSRVADALGHRASESTDAHGYVFITGNFGPVRLTARATIDSVGGTKPAAPEYEPIIGARS